MAVGSPFMLFAESNGLAQCHTVDLLVDHHRNVPSQVDAKYGRYCGRTACEAMSVLLGTLSKCQHAG